MKHQPQHEVLDPDYPVPDEDGELPVDGSDAPDDAYVIGEHGKTVQVLDGREKGKKRRKRGTKAWVMPAAFVLSALFVGLTVWNLSRALTGTPPPPKPSPFQIKQALYLGVMRVDAYKRTHGVTPETLLEASLSDTAGYSYVRIDSQRYVLSFRVDGPKLEYDSNDPKANVFGEPTEILTMGGTR